MTSTHKNLIISKKNDWVESEDNSSEPKDSPAGTKSRSLKPENIPSESKDNITEPEDNIDEQEDNLAQQEDRMPELSNNRIRTLIRRMFILGPFIGLFLGYLLYFIFLRS